MSTNHVATFDECFRLKDREGDRSLLGVVNRLDEMKSNLAILDTKLWFDKSSITVIRLPMEVRIGFQRNLGRD